jgi:hypothetical protein
MKWFFIILLTQTQGDLHEGFLWYDPVFDSQDQCVTWVNDNPVEIFNVLNYYYPGWEIEHTYCVRQDKLESINIQPYPEGTQT